MKLSLHTNGHRRPPADALILPFWSAKPNPKLAVSLGSFEQDLQRPLQSGDFTAKEGQILTLYPQDLPEKRILLLGLGDPATLSTETLRRAYATLTHHCRQAKWSSLNLIAPALKNLSEEDIVRGLAEGIFLANYEYDAYKKDSTPLLKKAHLVGITKKAFQDISRFKTISESVYLTRDLVNGNADEITPQTLAKTAQRLAKQLPKIKVTVFGKARIEKEKMGLLLAVNRGSCLDPTFIIGEYRGNPSSKETTVLVGKGITYDTGGLNIKTGNGMVTMKSDMAGAAALLGTLQAAATLKLKTNLTIVIASTENSISSTSYKPGDVYRSYSGKTVEVGNTDAEGRLILADALAYAATKLKPTRMIDLATLTGAVEVALGPEAMGMMSNHSTLAKQIIEAGDRTFERVWRLPLYEEYRESLKSDVADLSNIGGRQGAANKAATFLKEFVGDVPWAHLDIAGVAFLDKAQRYQPKMATGAGVRLMVDFLENLGQ